jgi:hypothetical protein
MPKMNNALPACHAVCIKKADGSTKRHTFPLPCWQKAKWIKGSEKNIRVPLALMLVMLIASAWLEPAPRHAARGCASGLMGQWSTACRGNGWAKVAAHALARR